MKIPIYIRSVFVYTLYFEHYHFILSIFSVESRYGSAFLMIMGLII